jgi:hypothetical protein
MPVFRVKALFIKTIITITIKITIINFFFFNFLFIINETVGKCKFFFFPYLVSMSFANGRLLLPLLVFILSTADF